MSNGLKQKIKNLYDNITDEEAQKATQNLLSFFELLIEIDQRQKKDNVSKDNIILINQEEFTQDD